MLFLAEKRVSKFIKQPYIYPVLMVGKLAGGVSKEHGLCIQSTQGFHEGSQ